MRSRFITLASLWAGNQAGINQAAMAATMSVNARQSPGKKPAKWQKTVRTGD